MLKIELDQDIYKVDLDNISGSNNFKPGYIDKEIIVGLQGNEALKRIINPYGGIRMILNLLKQYDLEVPDHLKPFIKGLIKTHSDGVFSAYTEQTKIP